MIPPDRMMLIGLWGDITGKIRKKWLRTIIFSALVVIMALGASYTIFSARLPIDDEPLLPPVRTPTPTPVPTPSPTPPVIITIPIPTPTHIDKKYAELGGSSGFLGPPVTTEKIATDGTGRYRHFQNGSIYWTPGTGAHEVHGPIRDRWEQLGWEKSFLGYPTTDEEQGKNVSYNNFQGGSIYWSSRTGARELDSQVSFFGLRIKRAGESIDYGNGYVLLIKKVDSGSGDVWIELQLDDRAVDEEILNKKENYSIPGSIYFPLGKIIEIINLDSVGDYIVFEEKNIPFSLTPHPKLTISSIPRGADIFIDGEYVGKTNKTITMTDLEDHSVRLELDGYKDAEETFQFKEQDGEIPPMIMNEIQPTPTLTATATPTPTLTATPTAKPTLSPPAMEMVTPTLTPEPTQTETPAPLSTPAVTPTTPSVTPGFFVIISLLAVLGGYYILKRKRT